jgi:hypothetical protein
VDGSEDIHGIASKTALQKMLTYPLYNIIPVGLEALDDLDHSKGCFVTKLISSTCEQGKFFNDFKVSVKNKFCSKPIRFVSSTQVANKILQTKNEKRLKTLKTIIQHQQLY